MSLGALITGYCLMAVRSVGMTVLLVDTMGPVVVVLLGTGELMDRVLALTILIAAGFQLVMMVRSTGLLLSLVEARQSFGRTCAPRPVDRAGQSSRIARMFRTLRRAQHGGALMVVDIDRFKTINDRFGHDVGDAVLQAIAHLLRTHARGEIRAARLGGEEFALLAGTETLDPAIALQLLGEIAAADMPHGEAITASIGVAEARADGRRGLDSALRPGRPRALSRQERRP